MKLVPLDSSSQLSLLLMQALQQQLAELETKLVQARTDSKAQVKGHNTGKKELEVGFPAAPHHMPASSAMHSMLNQTTQAFVAHEHCM